MEIPLKNRDYNSPTIKHQKQGRGGIPKKKNTPGVDKGGPCSLRYIVELINTERGVSNKKYLAYNLEENVYVEVSIGIV